MVKNPSAPPARCLEGYLLGKVTVTDDDIDTVVRTECHIHCRGSTGFKYPLLKVIDLVYES